MCEVGIDLADRKPKKIDLEMQLHADKAITLNCQDTCPYVIGGVEDWDVDDPADQPLEKVREIRDDVERRVQDLVKRADAIRADRSAISAASRNSSRLSSKSSEARSLLRTSAPALTRSSVSSTTRRSGRSC